MAEATGTEGAPPEGAPPKGTEGGGGDEGFKPPASQAELDALLGERAKREREKFTDYKDLKTKAEQFDKLAEANKTELQKLEDRVVAAEELARKSGDEALRLRIATKHGISDEDADLFLTGTDEATLTRQAEGLAKRTAEAKKNGNKVPREGGTSTPAPTDERAFARELFSGG